MGIEYIEIIRYDYVRSDYVRITGVCNLDYVDIDINFDSIVISRVGLDDTNSRRCCVISENKRHVHLPKGTICLDSKTRLYPSKEESTEDQAIFYFDQI